MNTMDETIKEALVREIVRELATKQRLAFASDFHVFADSRPLVLAGVLFEHFPKGPNTKRSDGDGDVVAHAIVMALAAALNRERHFKMEGICCANDDSRPPDATHVLCHTRFLAPTAPRHLSS